MPDQSQHTLDAVAEQFVVHRPKLYAIAYRTLGSPWSADDAVQEAWLRLHRSDVTAIDNLEAWLTTVISRVCIDMIRQRVAWREDLDNEHAWDNETADHAPVTGDPAGSAMRSEELAVAMRAVLDTLGPLERLALVLHDVFALTYDDIAPIVERTPTNARQLASRARARLRALDLDSLRDRQETAIDAFLSAARSGEFGDLLQLLDPDIELRSDDAAVDLAAAGAEFGAPLLTTSVRGGDAVARVFAGRAELTRLVYVDGVPAAAYVADGIVQAVYLITFHSDRIARLDVLAHTGRLADMQVIL